MALADVRGTGPTNAERIRSIMAGAGSLSLTTGACSYDLIAGHTVDDKGQLRLHAPAESRLAVEAACAPRGALAALLEFTDIAPTAVRDRVRARVTLSGWLAPSETQPVQGVLVLRLDAARATIERDGVVEHVGLDEVVPAEPDLLAVEEAALLTHLEDDHLDVVAQLSRLADPQVLQGAVQVRPFALDRYGFTLRCEYTRGHRDVRILFPDPLRTAAEIGGQVDRLLARACACPPRRGADHP
ncbi:DUF2470 domain-containing protein [Streptomyces sp. NPDC001970]